MTDRTGIGVLHHRCADRRLDINGIVVAVEQAVVVEHSTRTRGGNHGDPGSLVIARRGTTWARRSVAARGSKAGQRDSAAALYGYTGNGGCCIGSLSRTARTRI